MSRTKEQKMNNFNNPDFNMSLKYINMTLYGLIKVLQNFSFIKTSHALKKAYIIYAREISDKYDRKN